MAYAVHRPALGCTFLMLVSFVFFIVACAAARYYVDGNPSIGPFKSCTGYNTGCYNTGSCNTNPSNSGQNSNNGCDTFNAMRAFLVIATVLSGLAFLLLFFYACLGNTTLFMYQFIALLVSLAAICGIISMACGIAWNDDNINWNYGYGFDLEVAAWVIAFVTMIIWVCGYGSGGYMTAKP